MAQIIITAVVACTTQSEYNAWKAHLQVHKDPWMDNVAFDPSTKTITAQGTQDQAWP